MIIEGKQDGKSVLIWTLPDPQKLLDGILENSSFITQEKSEKIYQKLERLDLRDKKQRKPRQEVRLLDINRNPELDANMPKLEETASSSKEGLSEDLKKIAWEISK